MQVPGGDSGKPREGPVLRQRVPGLQRAEVSGGHRPCPPLSSTGAFCLRPASRGAPVSAPVLVWENQRKCGGVWGLEAPRFASASYMDVVLAGPLTRSVAVLGGQSCN